MHPNQDIIFHMSIWPTAKTIVRNHFQGGGWFKEEFSETCVSVNETFEVVITVHQEFYKVSINGECLEPFHHRLPLEKVNYVTVCGKISIDHVLIEECTCQRIFIFASIGNQIYDLFILNNSTILFMKILKVNKRSIAESCQNEEISLVFFFIYYSNQNFSKKNHSPSLINKNTNNQLEQKEIDFNYDFF